MHRVRRPILWDDLALYVWPNLGHAETGSPLGESQRRLGKNRVKTGFVLGYMHHDAIKPR